MWPTRTCFNPGKHKVKHTPLPDANKIYLPALQIKFGLFKNFVKALDKEEGFAHINQKFSNKSEAKLKQEIYVELEIRKFLKDDMFKKN